MTRYLLRLWLGMGVLATTAVTGCSHPQHAPEVSVVAPVEHAVRTQVVAPVEVRVQAAPEPPPAEPVVVPVTHIPIEEHRSSESLYSQVRNRLRDRRDFGDITANPAFAHDNNYGWLVGVLEKGPDAGMSLRYASVEEEDRYSGHVILSDSPALKAFQAGEVVRVEGQVVPGSAGDSWPVYQVQNITRVQGH